jgi:glycosyltransferase involved in cell wall biosynthesis
MFEGFRLETFKLSTSTLQPIIMKLGLLIYGSLETLSGGYLYDRKLVEYLREQGDTVEIISLPWRNYAAHLVDNLQFRLPPGLELLIQDELNHPSLLAANRHPHPYPLISLVHHLRASEARPAWQNQWYRAIEKQYLASVDGFIFNSITTKGAVEALIGAGKRSVVAYPPTDRFKLILRAPDIEARATAPGPLQIIFLGNVIPRKGLHTLIKALSIQQPVIKLHVVGALNSDSTYAREVQQRVLDAGLGTQVRFHGALGQDELAGLLRNSHLLVVPSSYEGFGIVYLEGMAFGLPAIGTTSGAAREIINDGENGYLVPAGDPAALAGRLAGLANDRQLLAHMSLQALKRFQVQPAWDETAGEIRKFLHTFLKQPHGSHD